MALTMALVKSAGYVTALRNGRPAVLAGVNQTE